MSCVVFFRPEISLNFVREVEGGSWIVESTLNIYIIKMKDVHGF